MNIMQTRKMKKQLMEDAVIDSIEKLVLGRFEDPDRRARVQRSINGARTDISKRQKLLTLMEKDGTQTMKDARVLDDIRRLMKTFDPYGTGFSLVKDHLAPLVEHLREYARVGEVEKKEHGEVMTPIWLVEDMLDKLPEHVWSDSSLKWLDPCNGCGIFPSIVVSRLMDGLQDAIPDQVERYRHIVENMIHVCDIQAKNCFLHMVAFDPKDLFDMNVYCGSFLDEGFDKVAKEVWGVEKFDVIIGNPPFNQMIDHKFLSKSFELSTDYLIFVHPSTWLLDEKRKQSVFNKSRELVKNNLRSIHLFNGNTAFEIGLFVPCVITFIDKNYNTQENGIFCEDLTRNIKLFYKSIWDINKFSNLDTYPALKAKILDGCSKHGSLQSNLDHDQKGDYWVNVGQIRGTPVREKNNANQFVKNDFYTFGRKTLQVDRQARKQHQKTQFGFKTKNEAENFLSFIKTDFARFCLSLYKINQNLHRGEMLAVPYMDFRESWTDKKLHDFFDLTEEEINFIQKEIPKFYD